MTTSVWKKYLEFRGVWSPHSSVWLLTLTPGRVRNSFLCWNGVTAFRLRTSPLWVLYGGNNTGQSNTGPVLHIQDACTPACRGSEGLQPEILSGVTVGVEQDFEVPIFWSYIVLSSYGRFSETLWYSEKQNFESLQGTYWGGSGSNEGWTVPACLAETVCHRELKVPPNQCWNGVYSSISKNRVCEIILDATKKTQLKLF